MTQNKRADERGRLPAEDPKMIAWHRLWRELFDEAAKRIEAKHALKLAA